MSEVELELTADRTDVAEQFFLFWRYTSLAGDADGLTGGAEITNPEVSGQVGHELK